MTERASSINLGGHSLFAYLKCVIPVILSAVIPVGGLEDRIGTGMGA